jgi:hypothetical protein
MVMFTFMCDPHGVIAWTFVETNAFVVAHALLARRAAHAKDNCMMIRLRRRSA